MPRTIIYDDPNDASESFVLLTPSHWMLLGYFFLMIIGLPLIYPFFWASAKMWEIVTTQYYVYDDKIRIETGFFSITKNEIQWYRVKSFQERRPFYQQLFGLSSFDLYTSDKFSGTKTLIGIYNHNELARMLDDVIENSKTINAEKELNHFAL